MFRQTVWLQRSHSRGMTASMQDGCDRLHDWRCRALPAPTAARAYSKAAAAIPLRTLDSSVAG
jgi:hypothetical protein